MTKTTRSRTPAGEQDADELVGAVLTASRVLIGVSARSLHALEQTVTVTQFRTLVVLAGRGQLNLNGLAERLGVQASTAMRMVDRLVSADLVARAENPESRREVVITLTPDGSRLVDEVTQRRRAEIASIVARMPTRRRGELVAALTAFADAADEPPAESGNAAYGW